MYVYKCYFIVGVIALRHLPTLLNVDVDVEIVGKTQIIHRKLSGRLTLNIVSKSGYVLLFIFHKHRHAKFR